jgi:hypothetical protein
LEGHLDPELIQVGLCAGKEIPWREVFKSVQVQSEKNRECGEKER